MEDLQVLAGKTTDEIVHLWNQAHPEDMILFTAESDPQPFQAARRTVSLPEWRSKIGFPLFEKRVRLTSPSTGITIFFSEQQPGSIAVPMIQDAGQGELSSLAGLMTVRQIIPSEQEKPRCQNLSVKWKLMRLWKRSGR